MSGPLSLRPERMARRSRCGLAAPSSCRRGAFIDELADGAAATGDGRTTVNDEEPMPIRKRIAASREDMTTASLAADGQREFFLHAQC